MRAWRFVDGAGVRPLAIALSLIVVGCGKEKPPPPPTVVKLDIRAATDVNLTIDNQGAPVETRVYQLGSKSNFDGAEFFPLYKADAKTLESDLLKKEQFLLIPGGAKTLELTLPDNAKAIGIFAAYRDFPNTKWRASADIPAHQTTSLLVTLDKSGVKLVEKP
jgi:type VI secretion system protein VasD